MGDQLADSQTIENLRQAGDVVVVEMRRNGGIHEGRAVVRFDVLNERLTRLLRATVYNNDMLCFR